MVGVEHATLGIIVLIALLIGPVLFYIQRARRGEDLYVRRIPAITAIDEATGRAAELGRPVSFTTGITSVSPLLYACLGVLHYIARRSAEFKTRLVVPQSDPQVLAITEDTVRDAYRDAGRSSLFDPKNLPFLSEEQFAFAAGYMGMVQREQVASTFLLGSFAAESLILAEAGQQVGAMQVAGSANPEQVAFFISACDYTLIGEELYGVSAYLTREPVQLGSLYGQDRAKLVVFLIIVVGIGIATYNSWAAASGGTPIPNVERLILWEAW